MCTHGWWLVLTQIHTHIHTCALMSGDWFTTYYWLRFEPMLFERSPRYVVFLAIRVQFVGEIRPFLEVLIFCWREYFFFSLLCVLMFTNRFWFWVEKLVFSGRRCFWHLCKERRDCKCMCVCMCVCLHLCVYMCAFFHRHISYMHTYIHAARTCMHIECIHSYTH